MMQMQDGGRASRMEKEGGGKEGAYVAAADVDEVCSLVYGGHVCKI